MASLVFPTTSHSPDKGDASKATPAGHNAHRREQTEIQMGQEEKAQKRAGRSREGTRAGTEGQKDRGRGKADLQACSKGLPQALQGCSVHACLHSLHALPEEEAKQGIDEPTASEQDPSNHNKHGNNGIC